MAPETVAAEQPIDRIRRVLQGDVLDMEFQPILDLTDRAVVGVEALARFRTQPLRSPDAWFREAAAVGLGTELEMAAVRRALLVLPHIPDDAFLSVNASPTTIASPEFEETVARLAADRIVVEVKEAALVREGGSVRVAFERMRTAGLGLAVDDVRNDGESFAGILRLAPDFVKLDLSLCRYIDLDEGRFQLVRDLVHHAREGQSGVIAEGIQSQSELDALRKIGVRHGQGYFLGLPGRLPASGTGAFAAAGAERTPELAKRPA